jgi:thiamine-phosphate pyrophosphorylase
VNLPPRVLPITPGHCATRGISRLLGDLSELKAAGAEGVLLREPALCDRDMLELALAARELFSDGWLGVHDRAHIGRSVCADGVHLGFYSVAPEVAKRLIGESAAIGVSHHEEDLSDSSMLADYRFLSPVFAPVSKAHSLRPLGLAALASASMKDRTWALGGMNAEVSRAVLDCGIAGVAAIGGVFSDGRPGVNMERLLRVADA